MILFPYAKINLGLDILCRRPDGYHDISTLFLPTDWCDALEIIVRDDLKDTTLTVTGRSVDCPMEKNLVMKAYRALETEYNLPPVEIRLHKVIPDGAGLGGGSADAAFTLKGLNSLLDLGISDDKLCEIASRIGADCPYFIKGGAMMASGTGTTLTPYKFDTVQQWNIVIVKPPFGMPTKEAYAGVTPHLPSSPLETRLTLPVNEWQDSIVNDFEVSVFAAHPEVRDIKEGLRRLGADYASMSGSGTAVYGIFTRDILADTVREAFPGCDIHVGKVTL